MCISCVPSTATAWNFSSAIMIPFRGGSIHCFGANPTCAATIPRTRHSPRVAVLLPQGGALGYLHLQTYGLHTTATHRFMATSVHWWLCEGNANMQDGRDESHPYNSTYAFVQQTSVTKPWRCVRGQGRRLGRTGLCGCTYRRLDFLDTFLSRKKYQ